MNNCIFRPVKFDDLLTICQFPETEMELFSSFPAAQFPLTVEQLKDVINQRRASSVMEVNGKVAGYSNLYDLVNGEYCFIGNVFIAPQQRNQGLGEYLIRLMMQLAFEQYGVQSVRVSCFAFNEKALRLYHRIGFVEYETEIRQDPDGQAVELFHMQYDLFRYVREFKKGLFDE